MTRNAGEALDEAQLALSAECETLLASEPWNSANVQVQAGTVERLELLRKSKLPAMRVLSHQTLASLKRIPRSHEGHQEDALEAVRRCGVDSGNLPLAVLIFVSHRWKRPNFCPELNKDVMWGTPEREEAREAGYMVGDPDDAEHSKALALLQWAQWFKREQANSNLPLLGIAEDRRLELFFWVDWACTDQENPGPDMAALPAYVGACMIMLAEWTEEYAKRAWCQVELLMGYAFMWNGTKALVLPVGFVDRAQSGLDREKVAVADPEEGNLSNQDDRPVIASLRRVAEGSDAFTCWRLCRSKCSCAQGLGLWGVYNVCLCCQCCGFWPRDEARFVRPGTSRLQLLRPTQPSGNAPEPTNRM